MCMRGKGICVLKEIMNTEAFLRIVIGMLPLLVKGREGERERTLYWEIVPRLGSRWTCRCLSKRGHYVPPFPQYLLSQHLLLPGNPLLLDRETQRERERLRTEHKSVRERATETDRSRKETNRSRWIQRERDRYAMTWNKENKLWRMSFIPHE